MRGIAVIIVLVCATIAEAEERRVIRLMATEHVVRLNDAYVAPSQPVVIDYEAPLFAVPQVYQPQQQLRYQYPRTYQMRGNTLYRRDCSSGRCRWVPSVVSGW